MYMQKSRILFLIVVATMFIGVELSARTITGRVVSGKEKLSNVIVTDGFNFAKTKRNGTFKIQLADSAKFVYIVTPSGYLQ